MYSLLILYCQVGNDANNRVAGSFAGCPVYIYIYIMSVMHSVLFGPCSSYYS